MLAFMIASYVAGEGQARPSGVGVSIVLENQPLKTTALERDGVVRQKP